MKSHIVFDIAVYVVVDVIVVFVFAKGCLFECFVFFFIRALFSLCMLFVLYVWVVCDFTILLLVVLEEVQWELGYML